MNTARTLRKASMLALIAAGTSLIAGSAIAQMYEKPYGFQARDRAGLAVYMKNLDEFAQQEFRFVQRRRLDLSGMRRRRRRFDVDREFLLHHPQQFRRRARHRSGLPGKSGREFESRDDHDDDHGRRGQQHPQQPALRPRRPARSAPRAKATLIGFARAKRPEVPDRTISSEGNEPAIRWGLT